MTLKASLLGVRNSLRNQDSPAICGIWISYRRLASNLRLIEEESTRLSTRQKIKRNKEREKKKERRGNEGRTEARVAGVVRQRSYKERVTCDHIVMVTGSVATDNRRAITSSSKHTSIDGPVLLVMIRRIDMQPSPQSCEYRC